MPETQFPNLQQKLQSQLSGTNGRLKFPLDNQDDYKGRIIFSVYDEDAARTQFGKALQKGVQQAKKAATVTVGDTSIGDTSDLSAIPSVLPANNNTRLEEEITGLATTAFKKASEKEAAARQGQNDPTFSSPTDILKINQSAGSVELYLPQQIQVQDIVSYSNTELGLIGAGVENALNTTANASASTIAAAAGQAVGQSLGRAYGAATGTAQLSDGMAALAFQRIGKRIPLVGQETTAAIRQATGITANPNVRTQFQSVPVREFGFNFTLIPKSRTEAAEITKIIKWFRSELYPEALIAGGVHYGYKFPNRFEIKIKYGNLNDSQASNIRFLPVYLRSFNTSYNPNGMGMHSDGSFPEIQFAINFAESRALNRQDIVERGF